jgi:hypothetical protein
MPGLPIRSSALFGRNKSTHRSDVGAAGVDDFATALVVVVAAVDVVDAETRLAAAREPAIADFGGVTLDGGVT